MEKIKKKSALTDSAKTCLIISTVRFDGQTCLLTQILLQNGASSHQPFCPGFGCLCFFFSSAFPFCTFSSNSSTSSFKSRFLSACRKILEFHQSVMHRQMSSKKIHGGFGIPFRKTFVSAAWCLSKPWTLDL